jgi:hypothetical protein
MVPSDGPCLFISAKFFDPSFTFCRIESATASCRSLKRRRKKSMPDRACGGHHSGFASICVDLYLDQQALDTTTLAGKLMFQITGAFAEVERSMIRQRTNAGLKRAKAAGKQLGRPRIDPALEKRIQSQLRQGHAENCC